MLGFSYEAIECCNVLQQQIVHKIISDYSALASDCKALPLTDDF